jgi:hypothetical protein
MRKIIMTLFFMFGLMHFAFAYTIEGTINSMTPSSLNITQKKPRKMMGRYVDVAITERTEFEGYDYFPIASGQQVRIKAKKKDGNLEAKRIRLVK